MSNITFNIEWVYVETDRMYLVLWTGRDKNGRQVWTVTDEHTEELLEYENSIFIFYSPPKGFKSSKFKEDDSVEDK